MFTYDVTTGKLAHDGIYKGVGYSGVGVGLNHPDQETVHNIGPVPRGKYKIQKFFDDPGGKGPLVAHLIPLPGTNDFGRSGFMIHGDNSAGNHTASHGCIILNHTLRSLISLSGDTDLEVV